MPVARLIPATVRRAPAASFGGLLVALAVTCGGCSGDSGDEPKAEPSTELTEITVSCDRFADTAQRITDAQAALYDGKDGPADAEAVDALVTELDALKEDAPEEVRTALTDLGTGFRSAQRLLADPTDANRAELVALTPALAEDGQTVTSWIADECGQ